MTVIIIHRCDSCGVETQEPEGWEETVDDGHMCPGCFRDYLDSFAAQPEAAGPATTGDE